MSTGGAMGDCFSFIVGSRSLTSVFAALAGGHSVWNVRAFVPDKAAICNLQSSVVLQHMDLLHAELFSLVKTRLGVQVYT